MRTSTSTSETSNELIPLCLCASFVHRWVTEEFIHGARSTKNIPSVPPYIYLSSLKLVHRYHFIFDDSVEFLLEASGKAVLTLWDECLEERQSCKHPECERYLRRAKPDDPDVPSNEHANR
jgi:hypothetical protein